MTVPQTCMLKYCPFTQGSVVRALPHSYPYAKHPAQGMAKGGTSFPCLTGRTTENHNVPEAELDLVGKSRGSLNQAESQGSESSQDYYKDPVRIHEKQAQVRKLHIYFRSFQL